MITSVNVMSIDSQANQLEPPSGIPIISEKEFELVPNNTLPTDQKNQQNTSEQQGQKDKQPSDRSLILKCSYLLLINSVVFGGQLFIQIYMLGGTMTWTFYLITHILSIFSFLAHILFIKCGPKCRGCFSKMIHIVHLLLIIVSFFLSIYHPVRYNFNNPEALDIYNVYDDFYEKNKQDTENWDPNKKIVKDVYYLLDMCEEIYDCQIQEGLQPSSVEYCSKLMNGTIKENNLGNLNSLQKGLIVYFVFGLILNFLFAFLHQKISNQSLSNQIQSKAYQNPEQYHEGDM